ncbi:DUF2905 domain-containing protein [Paenibacillus nasutitermitis]
MFWAFLGRYINLGRLPGDVAVEKGNVIFYFQSSPVLQYALF